MKQQLFTNSRMKMHNDCPMKEHLRYVECLAPKGRSEPLMVGSAFHTGLEHWALEPAMAELEKYIPKSQESQDRKDIMMAQVTAMLTAYWQKFERWPADRFETEKIFDLPILDPASKRKSRRWKLGGKMDGQYRDPDGNLWLVEYKTTGANKMEEYLRNLKLDAQVTLYLYALMRITDEVPVGCIYRIVRKPNIKRSTSQKNNGLESVESYTKRLSEFYASKASEIDEWLIEEKLYRNPADIIAFESELWEFVKEWEWKNKHDVHRRNTNTCSDFNGCEYLPICLQEAGCMALYEYRVAHEELQEEDPA